MDLNPKPTDMRLKLASFVILILLFLLVVPARWLGMDKQTYQKSEPLPSLDELTSQSINDDTDNDGTPNWKENLLGTNVKIKDSAPETISKTLSTEDKKADDRLNDPTNITSQVIKNTVGLSTYLEQQNASDPDVINSVASGIAEQAISISEAKKYTEQDLKVFKKENPESIRKYGNDMAILFLKAYYRIDPKNILKDIQVYMKTKDVKILNNYREKAGLITEMTSGLLALPVPDSAVELHLYLLNSSEEYKLMLLNLSSAESDPMRTFLAVSKYKETSNLIKIILSSYGDYFLKKNIIFGAKENAYFLTKVILSK